MRRARPRCEVCGGRGVVVADREDRWGDAYARPVHCIRCDGDGLEPAHTPTQRSHSLLGSGVTEERGRAAWPDG